MLCEDIEIHVDLRKWLESCIRLREDDDNAGSVFRREFLEVVEGLWVSSLEIIELGCLSRWWGSRYRDRRLPLWTTFERRVSSAFALTLESVNSRVFSNCKGKLLCGCQVR